MDDLNRIFFHELGHFIAHEINYRYFNGTGTKSIVIYPAEHNKDLFVGEAKINLSADEREKDLPRRSMLPEYLASSSYGCMFQAYYKKEPLNNCFRINGEDDAQKWNGSLRAHKIDDYRSEISAVESEYFELLKENGELEELMKLDPQQYLKDIGSQNYLVELDRLKMDTSAFVEKHREIYNGLIEKYRQIINKYLPEEN